MAKEVPGLAAGNLSPLLQPLAELEGLDTEQRTAELTTRSF